jgi:periplasmic protein CpxP/Spy
LVISPVQTNVQIFKHNRKGNILVFNNLKPGLAIATISLIVWGVTIPGLIYAQDSLPNSPNVTRKQHQGNAFKELNLTDTQKQQLKTIRQNTRQQIQSVLTEEQRTKLESAGQSGQSSDRKAVMKSLNLTDTQKQQMRDIRKKSQEQVLAILTPEQRSKFAQMHSQRSGK